MSAPNFSFEHRCIVITNDDCEWGNCPAIDESDRTFSGNRYYGTSVVKTDKTFNYYKPVITNGYYADACLDYMEVENAEVIRYYMGEPYYFNSLREFIEEFMLCAKDYGFPISKYRLRKLIGKMGERTLEETIFDTYRAVDEYLAELEEVEVNELLDKIKAEYGYEEVVCRGIFSNGEAIYAPVSNPLNLRKPVKRKKAC